MRKRHSEILGGKKVISAMVYMVNPDGSLKPIGRHKIAVYNAKPDEAVIVRDGRPIKLVNGKWVYNPYT